MRIFCDLAISDNIFPVYPESLSLSSSQLLSRHRFYIIVAIMVEKQPKMSNEEFGKFVKSDLIQGWGSDINTQNIREHNGYFQLSKGSSLVDYIQTENGTIVTRHKISNFDKEQGKDIRYMTSVSFIKGNETYSYDLRYTSATEKQDGNPKTAEIKITNKIGDINYNPLVRINYHAASHRPHSIYLQSNNENKIREYYKKMSDPYNRIFDDPPGITIRPDIDLAKANIFIPSEDNPIGVMKRGEYFESQKTENYSYLFDIDHQGNVFIDRLGMVSQTVLTIPNIDLRHLELLMKEQIRKNTSILEEYPIKLHNV
jgi:hypothetical protein